MKRFALVAAVIAVSACAKAEEKPMAMDSSQMAAPAAMDSTKMMDSMKMADSAKMAADKSKSKM